MKPLSDAALNRLRRAADEPDLSATPYRLEERIAQGGMGTVYRVQDSRLGRDVALKVLSLPDSDGRIAARMLREARVLARLEHPGIVPVHDVGTLPDGRPFYAMKLVRGRRLDEWLSEGTSLAETLRIFQRLCEAVAFAHDRGVVHRDLKPENIMVGSFGEVLVMDWGVAKLLETAPTDGWAVEDGAQGSEERMAAERVQPEVGTRHGTILGTPGYMAPEQERGEVEAVGPRADVFALGAILRDLLGQDPPPKALSAVIAKALAQDPPDRYIGAGELAAEISRFLAQLPVLAHRETAWDKLKRVGSKYRIPILVILAYLITRALLLWITGR